MITYQENLDSEVLDMLKGESSRQEQHIELIASENYASLNVLQMQGSILTNKYAEGYPGKRYYGGCEFVDQAERLAIERCKEIFGAEAANLQPHSGSQANAAVYSALLKPGDPILGMSLDNGGHLTHGSPVNFSGKLYKFYSYGLNDEEEIDYEQVELLANRYKPKVIVAGASAYSLFIDWNRFSEIAKAVGANFVVDMAHYSGLIAAGVYPSPVKVADFVTSTTHKTLRGPRGGLILCKKSHEKIMNSAIFPGQQGGPLMHAIAAKAVAFKEASLPEFREYQKQVIANAKTMVKVFQDRGIRVVSGRTDCHMFLIDLRSKGINGKNAEELLGTVNITVNKNSIPGDEESPFVTSGIRIGTPAVTTRGFKERQMETLSHLIADVLDSAKTNGNIDSIRTRVADLCADYPVYAQQSLNRPVMGDK